MSNRGFGLCGACFLRLSTFDLVGEKRDKFICFLRLSTLVHLVLKENVKETSPNQI